MPQLSVGQEVNYFSEFIRCQCYILSWSSSAVYNAISPILEKLLKLKKMVEYCGICNKAYKTRFEKFYHYEFEHNEFCPICDRKVDGGKTAKVIHLQFHGEHPCSHCWRIFEKLPELSEHVDNPRTHLYRCNKCHLDFTNNSDMWIHYEQQHSTYCTICLHRFTNTDFCHKLNRDEHFKKAHKMFPCCICFEIFMYEDDYKEHLNKNHRITCTLCSDTFYDEQSKQLHYVKVHQVKCQVCERRFNTEMEFQHHYNDMHRIHCDICDETFPDEEVARRHIDRNHIHPCGQCKQICKSEMQLQLHFMSEHQWKCTICDGIYESDAIRLRHIQVVHQFPCNVCDMVLNTQKEKDEHIDFLHQIKCDKCDKITTTISELHLHYNIMHQIDCSSNINFEIVENAKEYSIECSICNEVFKDDVCLYEHYRCSHINYCDVCDADFQFLNELTNHQLISHLE